ncbi:MAG: hypothetical protein KME17_21805 [Cyanosarcina radialis HA8281-LM2]|jgi:hypothetical protein|nr:hypothetical protein [Cyanosarcina radialis HA8281-LM2]
MLKSLLSKLTRLAIVTFSIVNLLGMTPLLAQESQSSGATGSPAPAVTETDKDTIKPQPPPESIEPPTNSQPSSVANPGASSPYNLEAMKQFYRDLFGSKS